MAANETKQAVGHAVQQKQGCPEQHHRNHTIKYNIIATTLSYVIN